MADNETVPFWWIVVFVLVSLGAGIGSIYLVGGSIFTAVIGFLL